MNFVDYKNNEIPKRTCLPIEKGENEAFHINISNITCSDDLDNILTETEFNTLMQSEKS